MVEKKTVGRYVLSVAKWDGIKEEILYPLMNQPVSLKEIDEATTQFINKQELQTAIEHVVGHYLGSRIYFKITYNQSGPKTTSVLYHRDSSVFNEAGMIDKLLFLSTKSDFALKFVERYKNDRVLQSFAHRVKEDIANEEDYLFNLQQIINKVTKDGSYKSYRDIYFFIKKYENKIDEVETVRKVEQLKQEIEKLNTLRLYYAGRQMNLFDNFNVPSNEHKDNYQPTNNNLITELKTINDGHQLVKKRK